MHKVIYTLIAITIISVFSCTDKTTASTSETATLNACAENLADTKTELIAWKDTIYSKLALMESEENKSLEMLSGATIPAAHTIQANIAKAAFSELKIKRDYLKQLYQVVMDLFAFDEQKFTTFKAKVAEGSLTDAVIEKELGFYIIHFDSYQNDVTTWKSVLKELEVASIGNQHNVQEIISASNH
jgi:hypothetical protein